MYMIRAGDEMTMQLLERLTLDPKVMVGKPVINRDTTDPESAGSWRNHSRDSAGIRGANARRHPSVLAVCHKISGQHVIYAIGDGARVDALPCG